MNRPPLHPCKGADWGMSCDHKSTCAHHLAWDGVPRPGDGSASGPTRHLCGQNLRDYLKAKEPARLAASIELPVSSAQLELFA